MKREIIVNISNITKVKEFIKRVNEFESDIDVISGRYVIDAKSIMGVFSLDVLKPLKVEINSESEEEISRFIEMMEEFKA